MESLIALDELLRHVFYRSFTSFNIKRISGSFSKKWILKIIQQGLFHFFNFAFLLKFLAAKRGNIMNLYSELFLVRLNKRSNFIPCNVCRWINILLKRLIFHYLYLNRFNLLFILYYSLFLNSYFNLYLLLHIIFFRI